MCLGLDSFDPVFVYLFLQDFDNGELVLLDAVSDGFFLSISGDCIGGFVPWEPNSGMSWQPSDDGEASIASQVPCKVPHFLFQLCSDVMWHFF